MTLLIEDYALIGNNATAALVGRNGSIDWLGFPRFDSPACFASLLGSKWNGRWIITPQSEHPKVTRHYRQGTLVLETEFSTPEGSVVLVDCMDQRSQHQDVVRLVRGLRGRVAMQMELIMRFDYGQVVPWVRSLDKNRIQAIAGAERLMIDSPVELRGEDLTTRAEFEIAEGQEIPFVLTWSPSYAPLPNPKPAKEIVANVTHAWQKWSSQHTPKGEYSEAVLRSIITLKALTDHRTGGIVAAPTTSLPEGVGGVRNWDYRFCWLRDSTFTLYALLEAGFIDEAKAWRDWLLRAVAGDPAQMQIMYGVAGERRLTEFELVELYGYEGSRPVRIGNAAAAQLQLDVYGEVLDSLYLARNKGLRKSDESWALQRELVEHLEKIWPEPDDGIWEIRGGRRQFTFSKVMAWVAVDRAVRTIEEFGEQGPLERWKRLRSEIHEDVCRLGFSRHAQAFVQYFGSTELDASVLMMPLVGFLPARDPRMLSTVAAIEKSLLHDGFVARYNTGSNVDGLGGGDEGVFLACSFWLADNYILQGRHEDARNLFEQLLAVRNDVGLLSEEYDPKERRQLGNFPQAFSHLALVNTAHNLCSAKGPAHHRACC
ncbi:MAG: glycoside hydrolase family 15 protein [Acidobacteriaceae bacterium]|nr:glycoside hydrolase family 15 protein [Acidobacteriaceae bacterium]MBV9498374.1 glycoside hydrolase family 15 protein [Acidobacteriaceae bacterium]